jgi:TM2 domain-containing membrane protein YozV
MPQPGNLVDNVKALFARFQQGSGPPEGGAWPQGFGPPPGAPPPGWGPGAEGMPPGPSPPGGFPPGPPPGPMPPGGFPPGMPPPEAMGQGPVSFGPGPGFAAGPGGLPNPAPPPGSAPGFDLPPGAQNVPAGGPGYPSGSPGPGMPPHGYPAQPPQAPWAAPPGGPAPYAPQFGAGPRKLPVGLVAIILGGLGIHKFMLGLPKEGWALLAATFLGAAFGFPWAATLVGVAEGVIYLTKTDADFHHTYVVGKKPWF